MLVTLTAIAAMVSRHFTLEPVRDKSVLVAGSHENDIAAQTQRMIRVRDGLIVNE